MIRDSQHILIEYAGFGFCLPWENDRPNFEGLPQYLRDCLSAVYEANINTIQIIPIPTPPLPPDWDGLLNRLISGDLYPLFRSITNAAFSNPILLVARNDIYGAISNPKISDRISALKAGLDMLAASGYEVSPENKNLWNQAIAELNFPDEVRL